MAKGRVAGNAKILLTLDDRVQAGLRKLQSRFSAISKPLLSLGTKMTAIGTSITGALFGAAAAFSATGSELNDMAARTGLSVEALGELGYAAKQNGSSIEAVEKATRGMARTILDAERGLSTATDNLDDLGVSLTDLQGLAPEDQFALFASRIADVQDASKKTALAMKIFGRSGTELLPMLETLDETREAAERLGLVMSAEDAAAADALGDAMDVAWAQIKRVVETIGAAIAGPLTRFLTWTQSILAAGIEWISQNKELIRTVALIGGGIALAGGAVVALGLGFAAASVVAGGLATAIGALSTIFGVLLSPITLVASGVAALGVYFANATEAGRAMVTNLSNWFGQLFDIAKQTFGGIATALAGGDIQAAGEILWAGLRLLWQKGTHELETTWEGFKYLVVGTMTELVFDVQKLWFKMLAEIKKAWAEFQRWWQDAFDVVVYSLAGIGETEGVQAELQNELNRRVGGRETESNRNARGIDAERDRALAAIEAGRKTAAGSRDAALSAKLIEAEKELAEARARFEQKSAEIQNAAVPAEVEAKMKDAEAAMQTLGGMSGGPNPGALLDVSLAAQQFGGRNEEIDILREIAKNTKPKKFIVDGGIPGD
jgi:hypothetical protein